MSDELFDTDLFQSLAKANDLRLYVEEGQPTNHFLTAFLAIHLTAKIGRAATANKAAIEDYWPRLKPYAAPPGMAAARSSNRGSGAPG